MRLATAIAVGALLGINRDLNRKPAGLRTHAMVTLGAALATLVVVYVPTGVVVDFNAVSRVVQGILTGIGFLGAGVIIRDAAGHVSGLTTAATIWVSSALGVLCGLGHWQLVGLATASIMIVLTVGGMLERKAEQIFHHRRHDDLPPPA
ncbi:MAG TPA: MgtC/SapB family protein [Methylophilaceae bacterium]